MDKTQLASDPQRNITVTASAGTGKTYLLITRLLRLLLSDAPPETILAITFTRKAATEMQQRITERLHDLLILTPDTLSIALQAIGVTPSSSMLLKAQTLYERLLRCEQPLRITTFHAFCQEILRRFPLEADVPPGFEILDSSGLLEKRALDALFSEATQQPDGSTARGLEILMSHCGGISNTETSLKQFLQHRSDWWAFTDKQAQPLVHAQKTLLSQLGISADKKVSPEANFLTTCRLTQCEQFSILLSKHKTRNNAIHAALLTQILEDNTFSAHQRITKIRNVFLTTTGEPRKRKESAAQKKSMGAEESLFLEIHHTISEALLALQDQLNRHQLYRGSAAWYQVGTRLLHHYQTMKEEQRLLDFADLEWRAYQLLNHHNNAHWIQYKLDQRINHLLVDEFQDTNPTQWRLLLPLLQELASGENSRNRSVFLVGDSKQSIYRFRRADPRLFDTAQQWLGEHLNAATSPLDISWRSAPAIIDFVNHIFDNTPLGERLTAFQKHDTHQKQLWGKVELLPLIDVNHDDETPPSATFRNPLHQPRVTTGDTWQQHYDEGNLIARRIDTMMNDGTAIKKGDELHPIKRNDVIILLRSRTHLSAYEMALREHNIAYTSNTRSTILDTLEAQDMIALLNTLISPHNNLALAQVLRSPLFHCSDESLTLLASVTTQHQASPSWFSALNELQNSLEDNNRLKRAHQLIHQWQTYAGELPVHDLLDHIYHEGDIQSRYHAAFPAHLHARIESNLTRFIELALEIDSGRYPGLPHFINRLKRLKEYAPDSIDEPASSSNDGAVRIMTIHAAKGLEAPVVFIADAARTTNSKRAHQAIVSWPSEAPHPSHFFLCGAKNTIDRDTAALLAVDDQEETREDANLLYVALTRARQHLIISGCTPGKGKEKGWYGAIAHQLMEKEAILNNAGFEMSNGTPLKAPALEKTVEVQIPSTHSAEVSIDPPQQSTMDSNAISPSNFSVADHTGHRTHLETTALDEDEHSTRGEIIHRILELITNESRPGRQLIAQVINAEYEYDITPELLNRWLDETYTLIQSPPLQWLFDPTQYHSAHNEMTINFTKGKSRISGIIDRLVINNDSVIIIDYKTHRNVNPRNTLLIAEHYRGQLDMYQNGIKEIWPNRTIKKLLIFTSNAHCQML
ncbi:MAG: UvrD-helicase domain-containing protein [Gammaproteobacteria bacterium]|nr:UvrD-helicase domain-containing protein [Gammaproteobacteria bacterium]